MYFADNLTYYNFNLRMGQVIQEYLDTIKICIKVFKVGLDALVKSPCEKRNA